MLKNAIIEIRDGLFEGKGVNFSELSKKYNISEEELMKFHDAIKVWKADHKKKFLSATGRQIWSEGEKKVLVDYVNSDYNKIDENGKTKTKSLMFEELSEIFFNRTKHTVGFYFYAIGDEEKEKLMNGQIETTREKYRRGDNVEDVKEEQQQSFDSVNKEVEESVEEVENNYDEENGDDLLDSMIELINNSDKFGNNKVVNMISGIAELSRLALSDDGKDDEIQALKSEIANLTRENRKLENKLEVANEKYHTLAEENRKFVEMNSTNQIKTIKDYNSKVKSLVNVQ